MSIGIFGIGLAAYWPQFEGLKERVEGYQRRVEERVASSGARWSRPAWSTASRPAARRATASPPRRSTS